MVKDGLWTGGSNPQQICIRILGDMGKSLPHFSPSSFLKSCKPWLWWSVELIIGTDQQQVTWLISFDSVAFLKSLFPIPCSLTVRQRFTCSGGSKRSADEEFPSVPTSLAFHSRLTRSAGPAPVICIVQDGLWETGRWETLSGTKTKVHSV